MSQEKRPAAWRGNRCAAAHGVACGDVCPRHVSPFLSVIILAFSLLLPGGLFARDKEGGHVPAAHVPGSDPALARAQSAPAPLASMTKAAPQVIMDDLGRPFPLPPSSPDRIVSMAPNVTEILFALGLGDRVVGVTRYCDWPPEAKAIPKIGGLVDPNVEVIQSLDPDLVIAFRGNPLRLVERIRKLGLPVFILDIGEGLEAVFPLIERIGRVTRTESRAANLAAGLRRKLDAVDAALRGVLSKPKVLVLLYGQGLWTAGAESYVNDLIGRAGAENVASFLPKKWSLYKRERIIEDDPDAIFILARSAGDFTKGRDWLARMPGVDGIEAMKAGRIYELDENAASRFGPRLVDVLGRMAALLHPDRFGGRT